MASPTTAHSLIIHNYQDPLAHLINTAAHDYENHSDSDSDSGENLPTLAELPLQRFEKRSIKIKPLNMLKDLISLRQEHGDKTKQVAQLKECNRQLRQEYEECVTQNTKLDSFLRKVQFTFQGDRKRNHTSKILMKAKKNLFEEEKEAKDRLKRLMKNPEASQITELKVYITLLNQQKAQLEKKLDGQKKRVVRRLKQQDYNSRQVGKYEEACERVRDWLADSVDLTKAKAVAYKQEKEQIKRKLRMRDLEAKKRSLRDEKQALKKQLLQDQGLEYQITLLQQRIKDTKKESAEHQVLKDKIHIKQAKILRLEKELREKTKTFDYMLEWTKELKKQLGDRKMEHSKKKADYDEQISKLTTQYQRYNEKYRNALFKEQQAKRKGPKDPEPQTNKRVISLGRQISLQEIKPIAKHLTFRLFDEDIQVECFVEDVLHYEGSVRFEEGQGTKLKLRRKCTIESMQGKQSITLQQLTESLAGFTAVGMNRQKAYRIARYIVEDGANRADDTASVPISLARQVLKNLLKRELEGDWSINEAQEGLRRFTKVHSQLFRQRLRAIGGASQQIPIGMLRDLLVRMGVFPFESDLYSEYLQWQGWKKRGEVGLIRLSDYDQLARQFREQSEQTEKDEWLMEQRA